MSTTPNYNLPQYGAEDRVTRQEINAVFSGIDTELAGLASAVAKSGTIGYRKILYTGTGRCGPTHYINVAVNGTPLFITVFPVDSATRKERLTIVPGMSKTRSRTDSDAKDVIVQVLSDAFRWECPTTSDPLDIMNVLGVPYCAIALFALDT